MGVRTTNVGEKCLALGAATALLLSAGLVNAQGVSVYGTLDAAVTSTNNGSATSSGISSGILSGSRLGVKGVTDFGTKAKGIFTLEMGLDSDTGMLKSYSGNPSTATASSLSGTAGTGFNRRSFVGVETQYGSLTAGRDYAPSFFAVVETDIFKTGMYGNIQTVVPISGGSEKSGRISNALFYVSPNMGGLTARLAYSFGSESTGVAGTAPKDANTFAGISAVYIKGPLSITGSYEELNLPDVAGATPAFTGSTTKRPVSTIGAKYDFGAIAISAGYWKMGTPVNATDAWVGASFKIGDGVLLAQVQQVKQDNPIGVGKSGTVYGLGYIYTVSKGFDVFASYGQVQNNSTAAFSLLSADTAVSPSAAGLNPSAFGIGARYNF